MKQVVAIIDAYSSGHFLAPEFSRRGCECIHIQSTKEIYPVLKKSFNGCDFALNIAFNGDLDELIRQLKKLKLTAVLPGTETGVHLADSISEILGLKSNGTKLSRARRNKFLMLETLRHAGLEVARQARSADARHLIAFKESQRLKRVVVKPVESAGSEDVRICETDDDIENAHRAIVGKVNMLGLVNHECIIQEYLEGEEYFINSVSLQDKHVVCDIWQHNKRPLNGFDFVYDRAELCDGKSLIEQELVSYNMRVLGALNIHFGPSHSEIIMTAQGPRLVEMGARLQGMSLPKLNEVCVGFGPVDLTVDCYVDEERFLKKAQEYRVKNYAMRVNLVSERCGVLKSFDVHKFETLPTFFSLRVISEMNAPIVKTINYFTVPGFVVLVSESRERLFKDYQTIREWERMGQVLKYE